MLTNQMLETAATEPGFDLSSIKEMMDGFDPAALLPNLENIFGKLSTVATVAVLIGPIVMLALGLAYLLLAPKEANYYFGYRCYFGMGSVRAWRFTQKLAGTALAIAGLAMTVIMFFISGSFAQMEVTAMAWQAVSCLAWEVGIALAVSLGINLTAAIRFNRKGELRSKKKK